MLFTSDGKTVKGTFNENKNQEVSQNIIIRQSKLDKMTVSKSLKKLVAEGYVQRNEHKEDTRIKTVSLTIKGKKLASKLVPIVEQIDATFFETIKKNDQQAFISILRNLVSKVED